jgi:hypothetical protein
MDYTSWRQDIFGQSPEADPVDLELLPETYSASHDENLAHVDQALDDAEVHRLFSREQIGIGMNIIYSNCCSSICFSYLHATSEQRRTEAIRNLSKLYTNYFDRYCNAPISDIGNDHLDGRIDFLCYMFWDIFILYPGNASPAMVSAALDVMSDALEMHNDNCITSAIHGLGHWTMHESRAAEILSKWLERPTTTNPKVLTYAGYAKTGCIE